MYISFTMYMNMNIIASEKEDINVTLIVDKYNCIS